MLLTQPNFNHISALSPTYSNKVQNSRSNGWNAYCIGYGYAYANERAEVPLPLPLIPFDVCLHLCARMFLCKLADSLMIGNV